jgi:N4-gp56 family major capsid protein
MARMFNAPPGAPSSVGTQIVNEYYQKKALIEAAKEQYFGQLADTTAMPKNMGKKIKRYHYLPMLDDANLNDQGIDAAGAAISATGYTVTLPILIQEFAVSQDAIDAAAAINAIEGGVAVKAGAGPYTVTSTKLVLIVSTQALTATVLATVPGAVRKQGSGNLYGSSKDVGVISGKLPALSETGGRVNRVGFTRVELEGTLEKFGFFDEYTQESMDFDSDAELMMHINREMIMGANELTEDALQIDLLNSAGVIKYAGDATQNSEIGSNDLVTYGDLMRLSIDLDNNRTPKSTKVITGSRMVDTKVVPAARIAYIGSELLPTFKAMVDLHSERAFIEVQKYADAGSTVRGEAGSVDAFRIVVVPEMMKWSGAGAVVTDAINYDNGLRYDVFPILVVGDESFTTIGFQTDGKSVKFKITHKAPGDAVADRTDPYGETGFMSIKWYYGFMALRAERLALLKTVARL